MEKSREERIKENNKLVFGTKDYTHFVVVVKDNRIDSGWYFKDDAIEYQKDYNSWSDKKAVVWTKSFTKKHFNF